MKGVALFLAFNFILSSFPVLDSSQLTDLGMFGTRVATNYSAPSPAPTQINQTPLNIFLLGLTSEH